MKDSAGQAIHLSEYTPPFWLVDGVDLTFRLHPTATRVLSRIRFRPNPDAGGRGPLRLDGEKLRLIAAGIDGRALSGIELALSDTGLTLREM